VEMRRPEGNAHYTQRAFDYDVGVACVRSSSAVSVLA
jgi:hypothetical protein